MIFSLRYPKSAACSRHSSESRRALPRHRCLERGFTESRRASRAPSQLMADGFWLIARTKNGPAFRRARFPCVPSMSIDLEVEVLWEVGRNDPSEPQGDDREGVAESSGAARPVGRRTETG